MSPIKTFIQKCMDGEARLEQIDDAIDSWHNTPGGFGVTLHEYLGMSWPEYQLWVSQHKSLEEILKDRGWRLPEQDQAGDGCCRGGPKKHN